jgi:hypothetical protein
MKKRVRTTPSLYLRVPTKSGSANGLSSIAIAPRFPTSWNRPAFGEFYL